RANFSVERAATYQKPHDVTDPDRPLGTHLFSLIGPSPDGYSYKWTAFGLGGHPEDGVTVDLWSSTVLGRIEYQDAPGIRRIAHTLHPGTTMVITDLAASPETRSAPDFTVITEDPATPGKR